MNSRFFACADCKSYIDAGYRWAYWLLEHPGVVRLGEQFSPAVVFAASDYWQPPPEERAPWLVDHTLPAVRDFLTQHKEHTLLYLEENHLYQDDGKYAGYTQIEIDRVA